MNTRSRRTRSPHGLLDVYGSHTAGAPPETARRYAAIVVTASVRRQIKSWASLLAASTSTARQAELE
ncbi:MAG: hypothetical protein ACLP4W_15255 [Mycobacterium sp.]|jgi:hypothetical protein|uniref:hypothetical protein n=1 Tax=Mycobacterium sp. TaxID=1785 RepID=UPI003F94B139